MQDLIEFLDTHTDKANAIATIASATAALLALFVSIYTIMMQQRHNRLSVMPAPEITVGDYENSLMVKIRNNGSGPLRIIDVEITEGHSESSALFRHMPSISRPWNDFTGDIAGRTVFPNDHIVLIELTQYKNEIDFAEMRDKVRLALSKLSLSIRYTDIYKSKFPTCNRKLDWFGNLVLQENDIVAVGQEKTKTGHAA
jgi:hypothetical protein